MGLEEQTPLEVEHQEAAGTVPEERQQLRVSGRDRPLVATPPRHSSGEVFNCDPDN